MIQQIELKMTNKYGLQKKYEQALNRAKVINPGTADYEVAVKIFPEIEENEDEKMRKQLLNWFKDCSWDVIDDGNLKREDIIAWLEKQGELKPIFRVGDYIRNKKTKDRVLIEQIDIANKVYCYVSRDDAAEIHSDFRFSEQNDWEIIGQKIGEQKTAEWNEEDEIMIKCCFCALDFLENFGKKECSSHWHSNHFVFDKIVYPEQVECWLKSLKQRMKV